MHIRRFGFGVVFGGADASLDRCGSAWDVAPAASCSLLPSKLFSWALCSVLSAWWMITMPTAGMDSVWRWTGGPITGRPRCKPSSHPAVAFKLRQVGAATLWDSQLRAPTTPCESFRLRAPCRPRLLADAMRAFRPSGGAGFGPLPAPHSQEQVEHPVAKWLVAGVAEGTTSESQLCKAVLHE